MNNNRKSSKRGGRERRISVRAVRRDPPDLSKIARAVVALALAQAEADAEAQAKAEMSPGTGNSDVDNATADKAAHQDGHEA